MNVVTCYLFQLFIIQISASTFLTGSSRTLSKFLPEVPTFADVASRNGFKCEVYNVTTEDGYVLGLFRIPGDSQRPVLLMHGLMDSADSYIGRENFSLAITLARAGYDVWAGNTRGNRYSRRHLTLNPDTDARFWDFSFHEMGYFDLPALIDFVLARTGQASLSAAGHSEGTTIFYVLGSTRPEYNSKIKVLASLASAAHIDHLKGILRLLIPFAPTFNRVLLWLHNEELLGFNSNVHAILRKFCSTPKRADICLRALVFPGVGVDKPQLEREFFAEAVGHFPTGTSRKTVLHWSQIWRRKKFAQFDFGPIKNEQVYGSSIPPEYNISRVTFDVGLYLGANDYLSTVEDVEMLRKQLPHVVEYRLLDYPMWNHLDHVVGKFTPKYLLPLLMKLFSQY